MILAWKSRRNTQAQQTIDEHTNQMLEYWDEIKNRYVPTIQRILNSWDHLSSSTEHFSRTDQFMEDLVRYHDIGKASKLYQDYLHGKRNLKGFRHELVSSYYAYEVLERKYGEKIAFLGALTIMLHHEPILMGQIKSLRNRELSAEVVFEKLKRFDGMVEEFVEWNKEKGLMIDEPTKDELQKFVFEMSVRARSMPYSGSLRFVVGSLLLPLVMSDYAGAKSRTGKTPAFAKILEVESHEI